MADEIEFIKTVKINDIFWKYTKSDSLKKSFCWIIYGARDMGQLKIHLCFLDLEHDFEAVAVEIDLEEDEVAFEDDNDEQTIDVTIKVHNYFATVMANVSS